MKNIFNKRKIQEKAFTFIEVMVVIAIIIIITSIIFALSGRDKGRVAVTNACNEVASFYNKTRNYALTGKIIHDTGHTPPDFVPDYFGFKIPNTNSKAEIYYKDGTDEKAITGETLAFKDNVTCGPSTYTGTPGTAYDSYYFSVPSGDATAPIPPGDGNITCVYCPSYDSSGNCSNAIIKTVTVSAFKAECE